MGNKNVNVLNYVSEEIFDSNLLGSIEKLGYSIPYTDFTHYEGKYEGNNKCEEILRKRGWMDISKNEYDLLIDRFVSNKSNKEHLAAVFNIAGNIAFSRLVKMNKESNKEGLYKTLISKMILEVSRSLYKYEEVNLMKNNDLYVTINTIVDYSISSLFINRDNIRAFRAILNYCEDSNSSILTFKKFLGYVMKNMINGITELINIITDEEYIASGMFIPIPSKDYSSNKSIHEECVFSFLGASMDYITDYPSSHINHPIKGYTANNISNKSFIENELNGSRELNEVEFLNSIKGNLGRGFETKHLEDNSNFLYLKKYYVTLRNIYLDDNAPEEIKIDLQSKLTLNKTNYPMETEDLVINSESFLNLIFIGKTEKYYESHELIMKSLFIKVFKNNYSPFKKVNEDDRLKEIAGRIREIINSNLYIKESLGKIKNKSLITKFKNRVLRINGDLFSNLNDKDLMDKCSNWKFSTDFKPLSAILIDKTEFDYSASYRSLNDLKTFLNIISETLFDFDLSLSSINNSIRKILFAFEYGSLQSFLFIQNKGDMICLGENKEDNQKLYNQNRGAQHGFVLDPIYSIFSNYNIFTNPLSFSNTLSIEIMFKCFLSDELHNSLIQKQKEKMDKECMVKFTKMLILRLLSLKGIIRLSTKVMDVLMIRSDKTEGKFIFNDMSSIITTSLDIILKNTSHQSPETIKEKLFKGVVNTRAYNRLNIISMDSIYSNQSKYNDWKESKLGNIVSFEFINLILDSQNSFKNIKDLEFLNVFIDSPLFKIELKRNEIFGNIRLSQIEKRLLDFGVINNDENNIADEMIQYPVPIQAPPMYVHPNYNNFGDRYKEFFGRLGSAKEDNKDSSLSNYFLNSLKNKNPNLLIENTILIILSRIENINQIDLKNINRAYGYRPMNYQPMLNWNQPNAANNNLSPNSQSIICLSSLIENGSKLYNFYKNNKIYLDNLFIKASRTLLFKNSLDAFYYILMIIIFNNFNKNKITTILNNVFSNEEYQFKIALETSISDESNCYSYHQEFISRSEMFKEEAVLISNLYKFNRTSNPFYQLLISATEGKISKINRYFSNNSSQNTHNILTILSYQIDYRNNSYDKLVKIVSLIINNNSPITLIKNVLDIYLEDPTLINELNYNNNKEFLNSLDIVGGKILFTRVQGLINLNSMEDILPKRLDIPTDFECKETGYKVHFHKHNDPNVIKLGDITNCCQTIGGAAQSCVIEGLINPYSGFISVQRNGKIIAQSWIWLSLDKRTLVIDSIETRYTQFVTPITKTLCEWSDKIPYDIAIGSAYTKVDINLLTERDFKSISKTPSGIPNGMMRMDQNNSCFSSEEISDKDVLLDIEINHISSLYSMDFVEVKEILSREAFNMSKMEKEINDIRKHYGIVSYPSDEFTLENGASGAWAFNSTDYPLANASLFRLIPISTYIDRNNRFGIGSQNTDPKNYYKNLGLYSDAKSSIFYLKK